MKKESLLKLIKNSQEVLEEIEFLIVGNQSIIGSSEYDFFEDKNKYLLFSEKLDLICVNHNYNDSLILESIFGEESFYHNNHNVYLQIVEESTCVLINNYQYRLNKIKANQEDKLCTIYFLDEETAFISKLLANRDRDMLYCQEMIDLNLVEEHSIKALLEKNRQYLLRNYSFLFNENIDIAISKIDRMFLMKKTKNEIEQTLEKANSCSKTTNNYLKR